MNTRRNSSTSGTNPQPARQVTGYRPDLDSREGDPRKRDQQDLRTSGRDERELDKDDPSRAPESGTP